MKPDPQYGSIVMSIDVRPCDDQVIFPSRVVDNKALVFIPKNRFIVIESKDWIILEEKVHYPTIN